MNHKSFYNPAVHHRRSIRLNGYDYSDPGAYFVTICTYDRICLFGKITNGEMKLNGYGDIVRDEWEKSPLIRAEIELGPFVIMPNHFHCIIKIIDLANDRRGVRPDAPTRRPGPSKYSVGAWAAGFKSVVTKRINLLRKTPGSPVWQRNYYEHIIRNETSYNAIAAYIANNPAQWEQDSLFMG
jgi:putative transposase